MHGASCDGIQKAVCEGCGAVMCGCVTGECPTIAAIAARDARDAAAAERYRAGVPWEVRGTPIWRAPRPRRPCPSVYMLPGAAPRECTVPVTDAGHPVHGDGLILWTDADVEWINSQLDMTTEEP